MSKYQPGSLVTLRNRDWVVMPSNDEELLMVKPLGGSEDEITGIYLPLQFDGDKVKQAQFDPPKVEDIGAFDRARVLYNAARLSFRSGAGPFRSLAKLSFRPRSYQMVPMIMALKQEVVRLLIADDVGVGKTIESLLVVKELLERKEISRFAVICLPHLCEQWQQEIKDKFDIDAVIIRSSTQAKLDREIQGDESVYTYYPFQVISIDFIKSESRRQVFVNECPEMIIVDEAHTNSKPDQRGSKSQHQRYRLIHDISKKENQHLLLLTATPHSGKQHQFQSLLGLLKENFEKLDLMQASEKERKELANHFIQRKRADVEHWMDEDTPFPNRDAGELSYILSNKYAKFYDDILAFAQGLTSADREHKGHQKLRYWTALALLRGVMSSPKAGVEMLRNRALKAVDPEELKAYEEGIAENPVMDQDYGFDNDMTPLQLVEKAAWKDSEVRRLRDLANTLDSLANLNDDRKAASAVEIIDDWLAEHNPVIFCRYIATAQYLGEMLKKQLSKTHKGVDVQVITSEDPDEVRKERIDAMGKSKKRVLVATDCLSEGINLQEYFTAVLHYDLPWNPNRLEQREGRVDRYGQQAKNVLAYLLVGEDNPIDGVVLKVILEKVRQIKKETGISMPFPEDSKSIMDAVLHSVLLNPKSVQQKLQMSLEFGEDDEVTKKEILATKAIEDAAEREKRSRTVFAQNAIKAQEIEEDLKSVDEAIGNPEAVADFIKSSMSLIGAQFVKDKKGFVLFTTNLPDVLKECLPYQNEVKVSFDSPTPEGYIYLGRNHLFVEQLCQYFLSETFKEEANPFKLSRASVIGTDLVKTKTTILLFRVRNVIEDKRKMRQLIAEEMLVWGYEGTASEQIFLTPQQAKDLLYQVEPRDSLDESERTFLFKNELKNLNQIQDGFNKIAEDRAVKLIEAHERFRKAMGGGSSFQVVYPVLPMDIMGIYILLPSNS